MYQLRGLLAWGERLTTSPGEVESRRDLTEDLSCLGYMAKSVDFVLPEIKRYALL